MSWLNTLQLDVSNFPVVLRITSLRNLSCRGEWVDQIFLDHARQRRPSGVAAHQALFTIVIQNLIEAATRIADLILLRPHPPLLEYTLILRLSVRIEGLVVGFNVPRLRAHRTKPVHLRRQQHQVFRIFRHRRSGSSSLSTGRSRSRCVAGSLRKSRQNQNQRKRTGKNPRNHRAEFSAVAVRYKAFSAKRFLISDLWTFLTADR